MDRHEPTRPSTRPAPTRHVRKDDADAFIRHADDQPMRTDDALAESFGEEFLRSATTGEDTNDELFLDSEVSEEFGGPFIVSSGSQEYALDDNGLPDDVEAEEEDPQAEAEDASDEEEPARKRT